MTWQPIETAPKDGTHILAYCVNSCSGECAYSSDVPDNSLCLFHAHAEGLSICGTDYAIVQWGGGYSDTDWESPQFDVHMPDFWFRAGSEFEEVANPTHWMPLPEPPA